MTRRVFPSVWLSVWLSLWMAVAALPLAAQQSWLSVTGSGIARSDRQVAVLQASVAVRDVNARPAMEEAARVLDRLTRRMRAIAQVDTVASGPVSVTSLRGRPPPPGRQGAWLAGARLTLTVTDPAATADVTERLLAAGAQSVEAVAYQAADPDALARTALERAVDDARRKAQGMAAAAGVRLGEVLEISGQDLRVPGPDDGADYLAGAVTMRASATVVFAISR